MLGTYHLTFDHEPSNKEDLGEKSLITRINIEIIGGFLLSEIINGELMECVEWEGDNPTTIKLTKESVDMILENAIRKAGLLRGAREVDGE